MTKSPSRIEIYLALFMGMKPSDLIARGISKQTVYSYSHRFRAREYKQKYLDLVNLPILEKEKGSGE